MGTTSIKLLHPFPGHCCHLVLGNPTRASRMLDHRSATGPVPSLFWCPLGRPAEWRCCLQQASRPVSSAASPLPWSLSCSQFHAEPRWQSLRLQGTRAPLRHLSTSLPHLNQMEKVSRNSIVKSHHFVEALACQSVHMPLSRYMSASTPSWGPEGHMASHHS